MVTEAQNLANLGSASRLAAQALNLDLLPPSSWAQDERIAYVIGLANRILQYPAQFDADTLAGARSVLGQNFNRMALDDYINAGPDGSASVMKSLFDGAFEGLNFGFSSTASLGKGAFNLISRTGNVLTNTGSALDTATATAGNSWLVPVAVVAFLALLATDAVRSVRRAAQF